jgi:hypothetical protein
MRPRNDDGSPAAGQASRARAPVQVPEDIAERIRALCLALPEVTVRVVTESYRVIAPKKLTALLD